MKTRFGAIAFCIALCLIFFQSYSQVPKLSSYPSVEPTIFLDFDGHYVHGTSWNWNGPINAEPSGFSPAAIEEIFTRVAEDFRPFNINVTTDSTVFLNAPIRKRVRVIITPTYQWYGSAGGVSFVNSFSAADDLPAFVFSSLLGNSTKKVAEAASHEAGHTLGLQHQSTYDDNCNKIEEYNSGKGTGEISWAPIMGNGYNRNLTTWTVGPNAFGCNLIQNDIDIIARPVNGVSFRADDVGDDISTATKITLGPNSFGTSGILTRPDDRDVFYIQLIQSASIKLDAHPFSVAEGNAGANLDIKMSLIDQNGDTLASYNPGDRLSAHIDTFLNAGTYYIAIDGVGNTYLSDTSSIGFFSVSGSYTINGILPVYKVELRGNVKDENHWFTWRIDTDEPVRKTELEMSVDGKNFRSIADLPEDIDSWTYTPVYTGGLTYRLKLTSALNGKVYYSNSLVLENKGYGKPVQILNTVFTDVLKLSSRGNFPFAILDATGKNILQGTLKSGDNLIQVPAVNKGVYFLRIQDGMSSKTEKIIKQ
ncbi:MAG TPA: DVUA0089 family protein [Parasegetibacter sp.]